MSQFPTALDLAQIGSAIGAGAAALFAYFQSRQTKHQMEHTLRAWVGIDVDRNRIRPEGMMEFHMKNYGQLPATKVQHWSGCQLQPFTKEQLRKIEKKPNDGEASLLPGGYHSTYVTIPEVMRLIKERVPFYYAVIIEYSYSKDKFGRYEMFGHDNIATKESAIDYEYVQ